MATELEAWIYQDFLVMIWSLWAKRPSPVEIQRHLTESGVMRVRQEENGADSFKMLKGNPEMMITPVDPAHHGRL